MPGKVVSQAEWTIARKELLVKEKEATRANDALSAQIRALPMVQLSKSYTFTGPTGPISLASLFQGRQQLVVYHFMFDPDSDQGCNSCSFLADNIPDLRHLASRSTSLVFVSRAPLPKIQAFQKRMGWDVPWYSSAGSDFNYDFHVTQDEAVAPVEYNFKDKKALLEAGPYHIKGEQPGISAFYREGDVVFHTYSAYARGLDRFLGTYSLLDITHLGRQDGGKIGVGFPYHDQYD